MTYETVASISGVVGLILFMTVFAAVLVYTFWPANRSRFERAARAPLEHDDGKIEQRRPK